MEQPVDWIPALIVLVLGAIAGAIVLWRSSRRTPQEPAGDDVLDVRDQRARLDALIVQLRELDDLAGTRTSEQLAEERRALEIDAALTLRELTSLEAEPSGVQPAPGAASTASEPPAAAASPVRGFLWGALSVGAVALLVIFATRGSFDREPGGSPTGGSMSPAPASEGPMVDLTSLRQAVEQNPNDFQARLDLAQALLFTRDLDGVAEQTRYVLSREPNHPRALSYESLLQLAAGNLDQALATAQRAVSGDPDDPEAWVHLALIHAQRGAPQEAEQTLRTAMERFPADAAALQGILTDLVPAAGAGAAAARADTIQVVLEADRPVGGIVFVFVFGEGNESPIAVKRESIPSFPARIEIGPADVMTGGALPAEMRVEARLDSDGAAATRDPADLSGSAENVSPGSVVRLRLAG